MPNAIEDKGWKGTRVNGIDLKRKNENCKKEKSS